MNKTKEFTFLYLLEALYMYTAVENGKWLTVHGLSIPYIAVYVVRCTLYIMLWLRYMYIHCISNCTTSAYSENSDIKIRSENKTVYNVALETQMYSSVVIYTSRTVCFHHFQFRNNIMSSLSPQVVIFTQGTILRHLFYSGRYFQPRDNHLSSLSIWEKFHVSTPGTMLRHLLPRSLFPPQEQSFVIAFNLGAISWHLFHLHPRNNFTSSLLPRSLFPPHGQSFVVTLISGIFTTGTISGRGHFSIVMSTSSTVFWHQCTRIVASGSYLQEHVGLLLMISDFDLKLYHASCIQSCILVITLNAFS